MKSITQASAELKLSTTRVRLLCTQGRIPGAQKVGNSWVLPDVVTITPPPPRTRKRKSDERL